MVPILRTSNLPVMTSGTPPPQFQLKSGRIVLTGFSLVGIFMLANVRAEAPSGIPQSTVGQTHSAERVTFKTDECGDLATVQSSRSIFSESSSVDDSTEEDEGDSMSAWGMSDDDRELSTQWMLQHPDMAIDTDAIQRSCGSDPLDDEPGTSGVA